MPRKPVKSMPNQTVTRDLYRNGAIHRETPQVDGMLHGTVRSYHNNGKLASEEPYDNGLVHGVCRRWAWSGKLLGCYPTEHGTAQIMKALLWIRSFKPVLAVVLKFWDGG